MGPPDIVDAERMAGLGTTQLVGERRTVDGEDEAGWENASRRRESRSTNSRSYSRIVSRFSSEMFEEKRKKVLSPVNWASSRDLGERDAENAAKHQLKPALKYLVKNAQQHVTEHLAHIWLMEQT